MISNLLLWFALLCACAQGTSQSQQDCPTEQLDGLPDICQNVSAFRDLPSQPENSELHALATLSCLTCQGQPLYDFMACAAPDVAELANVNCAENEDGSLCFHLVYPPNGAVDFRQVHDHCRSELTTPGSPGPCSDQCKATLQQWVDLARCCIVSVYGLQQSQALSPQIQAVVSQAFWDACGIARPEECQPAFSNSTISTMATESATTDEATSSTDGSSPDTDPEPTTGVTNGGGSSAEPTTAGSTVATDKPVSGTGPTKPSGNGSAHAPGRVVLQGVAVLIVLVAASVFMI